MTTGIAPGRAAEDVLATDDYRNDGVAKVTGQMQYTADFVRPDGLWAAFVQSPHAYAKIVSIDAGPALAIAGVRAVLTADDIGRPHFGRVLLDWPVLAFDVVRFAGDRVAAVAAETRSAAQEAARAVRVVYEELTPVLDARAALEAHAPVLHPAWDGYGKLSAHRSAPAPRTHPNVYAQHTITKGNPDIEALFAKAARVFEHDFETPRTHPGFIEPRATVVWIENGVVHIQSPNKTPFMFRRQFAHVAGLAETDVIIEPSAIGGDFGGKGLTADEFPCYYLARATGRPVQHVATYTEEFRRGPTRHRTSLNLRSAVDEYGQFIAHVSTVVYDGGAYAATKPIATLLPGSGYGSVPYRVPNVRVDLRGVYTNTLPAAHVRGPADFQTFTSWEQHVDLIARALGDDPLAFRLKNVIRDGDALFSGEIIDRPMATAVLETLRRECGPAPSGSGNGRGIALTCNHTGSGDSFLRMRLSVDGSIVVSSGAVDQGAGVATVVSRVTAAVLGADPRRVRLQRSNTADALPDGGSGHDRVTHIVGRAAFDAAERMRARLEDVRENAGETFEQLAQRACAAGPVEVIGEFRSDHGAQVPGDMPFGGYAVDVHVDAGTGAFSIRNVVLVTDVGQIINPIAHQGQIEGAFIFGLGAARTEEVSLDEDGRVVTLSLADYKLPSIADIPPLRTVLIQGPSGDGPFGARGIGELFGSGVAAALLNAIDDAVGARLRRLPARAEDIYAALQRGFQAS